MIADFTHGVADLGIRCQESMVLVGIPIDDCRQLLRDSLEEANDHTYWCSLHVVAEFVDSGVVRHTIVAIELHALPHGEQD